MSFVVILPSIYPPWTDACVSSMAAPLLGSLEVFDNTERNRGVAVAWNHGVRIMRAREADWLIIVSAGMRFGKPGGTDFTDCLQTAQDAAWAVEAGVQPRREGHGFGWHLIAFRSSTFDRVGLFDENFFAYWEDNDFGHRIRCASPEWHPGVDPLWPKVDVDADLAGYGHGVRLGGAYSNPQTAIDYYRRKWGGPQSCEEWTHPFNLPDQPLSWWPTPNPHRQPGT